MMKLILAVMIATGGGLPPVPFTTIAEGQQSSIEKRREVVVRTAADWKALWKEHATDQPLPAVDFSKSTVVGVFLGVRNTGGYKATISSIDRDGKNLVVTWREEQPARDAIVTQMLTFPYHLVRIDETSADVVTFRRSGP
jgi:hypothetical protein